MPDQPTVLFLTALSKAEGGVAKAVSEGIFAAGAEPVILDATQASETFNKQLSNSVGAIADLSNPDPDIMYMVGMVQASGKPLIPISARFESIPNNLASIQFLIYKDIPRKVFVEQITKTVSRILHEPQIFSAKAIATERQKRQHVFISYSHSDKEYLERLMIHLKPLQKEGLLTLWADTHLRTGDRWKPLIQKELARSTVAILLISADFLASDFIVENELPPLLKAAEEKGTRILPIILKPCRFSRDRNLQPFQSVNDPKEALVLLSHGEQERVYDNLSSEVERYTVQG